MKLKKPKFWDKKSKFNYKAILLLPITLIVLLIIFLKKKVTKVYDFKIPIICVGNIYIGGTGKTPASIFLADELEKLNYKPVIIKKYYKNHADEHNLIKSRNKNLILCNNRIEGINDAYNYNFKTVILDDGMQDYKIKRDLNIVCFHQNQQIGNGFVLPSGPLREDLNALKNIDIVLINGKKDNIFEKKLLSINNRLDIFYSYYNPINIDQFKNHNLLALAGIANPENFFMLLENNNLVVKKKFFFPDHYEFTKKEIQEIANIADKNNLKIIMTEKDFYKIHKYNLEKMNYLKISLEIFDKDKFIKRVKKIYD